MESYSLRGVVKPYRGNGRKFGYPTANIEIPLDTAEGVFFGTVELRGQKYLATIFVGNPVTLDDPVKRAEAHLLDFPDEDLYGEEIVMHVLHKHRDNQKYASETELIAALHQDTVDAREYFEEHNVHPS